MILDKQHILQARARALAREPDLEEANESLQAVEFLLAGDHFAIDLKDIREVYLLKELTPIPTTPPFVAGMVNIRGQVLTVLDIKVFFDLPPQGLQGLTELGQIIIVRWGETEVGLLADSILGVCAVPLHTIQPPLSTFTGIGAAYLRGVTPQPLAILDVAAILSDPKIIVNEEVES